MLGGRGHQPTEHRRAPADTTCPSVRVPGASVAARVAQQRASCGSLPADGTVNDQRRGDAATSDPRLATSAPSPAPPVQPVRLANRWSVLADAPEDNVDFDDVDEMQDVDAANDAAEDEGEGDTVVLDTAAAVESESPGPTPAQLRLEWDRHCAALRLLEKDADAVPPTLIEEARRLRDQAEGRWRAAKPQQPLHKRVRWAEAELREAQSKEDAHRKELDDHLAAAAHRTRELEARLEVDRARTERKKAALADLRGRETISRCPATEAAARMAIEGISTDIAPAMSAIAASLGEGESEKRKNIQAAIRSLARVEEVLREGARAAEQGRPPEGTLGAALGTVHYDISDTAADAADGTAPPPPTVVQLPLPSPTLDQGRPNGPVEESQDFRRRRYRSQKAPRRGEWWWHGDARRQRPCGG